MVSGPANTTAVPVAVVEDPSGNLLVILDSLNAGHKTGDPRMVTGGPSAQ
ncbi:MAG: hypothetical protein M0027_15070 [Candidatus Dormibacteraeota bacterium]|nr:hypothetical protein [Candidatus Dormibacteraeota bacterium]